MLRKEKFFIEKLTIGSPAISLFRQADVKMGVDIHTDPPITSENLRHCFPVGIGNIVSAPKNDQTLAITQNSLNDLRHRAVGGFKSVGQFYIAKIEYPLPDVHRR